MPARAPSLERIRGPRVETRRSRARTGVLAAAAVGVLALAAILATRDGLPGGATTGSGDGAGAFPSLPAVTVAPAATAPEGGASSGGGKGKGNGGKGNGGGKGN